MTCHSQRIELLDLVDQAVTAGARRDKACDVIGISSSTEFASLPPSQIVPILADREEYIGSESTLYRVLKDANQLNHRGRAKVSGHSRP